MVRFRPTGGAQWYSVPMNKETEAFVGILPKPTPKLKSLDYYVEVTARDFATGRTQEYTPEVVSGLGACQGGKITASTVGSATVVLEVPPGAPAVPAGFSSDGVVSATSAGGEAVAGAAVGAAARTGGGISTTALVVGGVVVAGGAAAAIAASGGGNDTPPAPPAPPTLTGTWRGQVLEALNQICPADYALTLVLTQSGSAVTGTMALTVTSILVNNPPAGGTCAAPGFVIPAAPVASGSMVGNAVTLSFTNGIALAGTLNANGTFMSGASTGITGTWSATKQ